jgi:hypothetical protein
LPKGYLTREKGEENTPVDAFKIKQRRMTTIHHDKKEMALFLLFDEIVQPDVHPDKKTENLYESMKSRLGLEKEQDNSIDNKKHDNQKEYKN